jgi:hypothetical protein
MKNLTIVVWAEHTPSAGQLCHEDHRLLNEDMIVYRGTRGKLLEIARSLDFSRKPFERRAAKTIRSVVRSTRQ